MFIELLPFAAAIFCFALSAVALLREGRSKEHRFFALGMIVLGLEQVFVGLSLRSVSPDQILYWQQLKTAAAALVPGIWLVFSLCFGREDYRDSLRRWSWLISAVFVVPLSLVVLAGQSFFLPTDELFKSEGWILPLGWSGRTFFLVSITGVTLVLANLEKILWNSVGRIRWQIKFLLMGLGGLFALRLYVDSQVALFSLVDKDLELINAVGLLLANTFIVVSLLRTHLLRFDFYVSQRLVYRSVTVIAVGSYLIGIGALAGAIYYFGWALPLPPQVLFVFVALLVLAVALLSDRLRQDLKRSVSRHLKRPFYDYREIWASFTMRTMCRIEIRQLCKVVAEMVSETFQTHSVTVWLLDSTQGHLELGASTAQARTPAEGVDLMGKSGRILLDAMRKNPETVDVQRSEADWVLQIKRVNQESRELAHIEYLTPFVVQGELLGVMTLGDRVRGQPFSMEDLDLLKVIADQAAAQLLNLRLSKNLQQAREMEIFQNMSAFMLHDLKNLASRLSLSLENLRTHFDQPELRENVLRVISQSVEQTKTLCRRLSELKDSIELNTAPVDLNTLLKATLDELKDSLNRSPILNLHPMPIISIDPEQIQKVLTNMLLNANEAMGNTGQIRIETSRRDGFLGVTITDNGCGISREFIRESLFRPLQTTKTQGMGIGLFHSKVIVEAHQGRIEVESEEGVGSTFRVILPLQGSEARKP